MRARARVRVKVRVRVGVRVRAGTRVRARVRVRVRSSTLAPLPETPRIFGTRSRATSSGCAASTPKGNLRSS